MDEEDIVVSGETEVSPATEDVPNLESAAPTAANPVTIDLNIDLTPKEEARPFTDDDIVKYLSGKTHDDLKVLPAYNAQIQRGIAKIQSENARAQQEYAAYAQWDQWFRRLNEKQFISAMQNPEYAENHARVVQWRASGAPTGVMSRQQVAEEMLANIQQTLGQHEELKDLAENWDELTQEKDFGQFIGKVIKHGVDKRHATTKKALETEARAQVAKILAQYHINVPEPLPNVAAPALAGGKVAGWTKERYLNATPEEAATLTPSQIDALFS